MLTGTNEEWTIDLDAVDIDTVLVKVAATDIVLRAEFVVLFTPVHPRASRVISALFIGICLSSKYFFTYPYAVLSAIVPIVPALKVVPFPKITSVYL